MADLKKIAARALASLDLTNLNDDCTPQDIIDLCARAQTKHGKTAAICIWPRFVAQAVLLLKGTGIRVATVVNFPAGTDNVDTVLTMTSDAVADGADEIDMVIPYRQLIEGHSEAVASLVTRVKGAAGAAKVKTILETGVLEKEPLIREACQAAVSGGSDYLKTSTGKVPVNATPESGRILLEEIAKSGKQIGFKPAGGVKTTADAGVYLNLCDEIMGEGWANPDTFRIGASGVLTALLATLDGEAETQTGEGY